MELTGIPGAGKTTLFHSVKSALEKEGLMVHTPDEWLWSATFKMERDASLATLLASDVMALPWILSSLSPFAFLSPVQKGLAQIPHSKEPISVRANRCRNFLKKFGLWSLWCSKRKGHRDRDIVLWDEGMVHSAMIAFVHKDAAPQLDILEGFLNEIPLPDVLIGLKQEPEAAHQILMERGSSWRFQSGQERMGKGEEHLKFLTHADIVFQAMMNTDRIKKRALLVERSKEEEPEERAQNLVQIILEKRTQDMHA